jgi:hypothetical protein
VIAVHAGKRAHLESDQGGLDVYQTLTWKLIATRSGSSESCDDGTMITCRLCDDLASMPHCKPSLLVNIAHIAKVNDLKGRTITESPQ